MQRVRRMSRQQRRAPTALQSVLNSIARTAAKLCDARDTRINLLEGDHFRLAAYAGTVPLLSNRQTHALDRRTPQGDAALRRRVLHIRDMQRALRDRYTAFADVARASRMRTVLVAPLTHGRAVLGTILIRRDRVQPFTPKQIALLKAFADQAAIAVENARLSDELAERNRALTEALEQQTATSEILQIISSAPTQLTPVLSAIAERAARLCQAWNGTILLSEGNALRMEAHYGPITDQTGMTLPIDGASVSGRAFCDGRPIHVEDLSQDADFPLGRDIAIRFGVRTALAVPLIRQDVPIGVILIRRTKIRRFSDKQIALLRTFADQAVIAIENARLFTELQTRNLALTEALEQQTATSEILRVISRSPTDVQPVFHAIIANAVRLCGGVYGVAWRYEKGLIDVGAVQNFSAEDEAELRARFPRPLREGDDIHRTLQSGRMISTPDIDAATDLPPSFVANLRRRNARSGVIVPIQHDDEVVGAIGVSHRDVDAFSASRIELLKTFADQAVIAIENVRLFNELQSRTHELTRSVQQLTALGEVGQALSSTLDVETVLTTIASRATQLTATDTCTVYEYEEAREEFHLRATHNVNERVVALIRIRPIRKGEGATGRVAETHAPVQVDDLAQDSGYHGRLRQALLEGGVRSVLAVPMLREARLIGVFIVTRKTPGRFADEVVALLRTFATQSAIAIHNARLYRELEAKSRELEAASHHKSQFLANMSHELRTPMNAIIGYTELIADGIYGAVPEPMRDVLTRVDASGRHLLGLINDVLDLSKIEAGQLTLTLAEYSMKEVVEAVLATAEPLAAEKHLKLVVDIPPDLPTGRGDQRRLAQVLLNLVGNAIKFTDEGHVALRVGAVAGMFAMAVSDTGPGIPLEDQERIFEEFQQADTSRTRPKGGTGLGLAIARRIVAMHGGRIWVESTPGAGATFRITMPMRVEQQVVARGARS